MREKINLNGAKNVHFIGIGGISMSGLAEILLRDGFVVSGSDDVASEITKRLAGLGIKIFVPNAAENISRGIDLAVFTAAVKPDNPEFKAAKEMGIPLVERAAFIGKILRGYDPICVAGSHGKTTTTSLVAEVALAAGLDPTIQIGGHMNAGGLNYRVGESPCFVLEACEYSNSFHHWRPKIGVILNIDADHLDFFGSMENLIGAFAKFAGNIREDGALIINKDAKGFEKIASAAKCEIITFSLVDTSVNDTGVNDTRVNEKHFFAENISYNAEKPVFDVWKKKNEKKFFLARVELKLPGEYNLLNALACFAAASQMGISSEITARALNAAQGTKRRFEFKGEYNGAKIVDDYAHHPTEIRACLAAARQRVNAGGAARGKVICLFQPHTYTRTKNLLREFAEAFTDADQVILLPIYAAREPFDAEISSEILAEEIKKHKKDVIFAENFDKAGNFLKQALRANDLLITMGAGDVYEVGEKLLRQKFSTLSTESFE